MNNITYELLNLSNLKIETFNRSVDMAHAKRIAAYWDDKLAGVIVVSKKNGYYDIIDGQHRVVGAKMAGKKYLPCLVYHNMTTEEDAAIFVQLDKKRKNLNTFDYVKASKVANDEIVTSMYEVAEMVGFTIDKSKGDKKICAVRSLLNVLQSSGKDGAFTVLNILNLTWGGDKESLKGEMIEGLNLLLKTYGTALNQDRLIQKLKMIQPYKIIAEANSDASGGRKRKRIARVMLRHYNHNLQSANRLQDIL